MKTYILSFLAVILLGFSAIAQTNTVTSTNTIVVGPVVATNTSTHWPMEFTLSGGGVTTPNNGNTEFGIGVTLSVQPFSAPIWLGINQEIGWEPALAGATDLYCDYSWSLLDNLSLNTGWSVGATYDRSTLGWRTGPEISLEYYTKGNAFIFAGLNYDLETNDADGWHTAGANALRYSVGVGIAF